MSAVNQNYKGTLLLVVARSNQLRFINFGLHNLSEFKILTLVHSPVFLHLELVRNDQSIVKTSTTPP
jgi:hypothetical protein